MTEPGNEAQANDAPVGEQEDSLERAAAAGPPLQWDNTYGDAGDGRPEVGEHPDLMYQIFREPEELREERGE